MSFTLPEMNDDSTLLWQQALFQAENIGTAPDPTHNIQAEAATGDPRNPTLISQFTAAAATGTMAPTAVSMAGNSQPHANIQPYLTINFIIALQGIFPSRS